MIKKSFWTTIGIAYAILNTVAFIDSAVAQVNDRPPTIQIIQTGQFRSDVFDIPSGSRVFALVKSNENYLLENCRIIVDNVYDAMYDDTSALKVTLDSGKRSMLILYQEDGLENDFSEGPITTITDRSRFFYPGQKKTFLIGDRRNLWGLSTYGNVVDTGMYSDSKHVFYPRILNYRLVLHNHDVAWTCETGGQAIIELEKTSDEEEAPIVLWIGDLDRDGKPDFLVELGGHYNVSKPTLFLSSKAAPGDFVKLVSWFRTIGC